MNAVAPAPASFLQSKVIDLGSLGQSVDPSSIVPGMPPNFGREALPHVYTFQAMTSNLAHVYRPSDEALRHDKANARFMRNDLVIREPLDQRIRSQCLLNWHLEAEDETDPRQKEVVEGLTDLIDRIPRFMQFRETLAQAIWFGRYAAQTRWEWRFIKGQRRQAIVDWLPLHGDKIVFRFDDGSKRYDPKQIGIRVGASYKVGDMIGGQYIAQQIEPADSSLAYFVPKWQRRLLAMHRHQIEDGEFEDHLNAGRIHGVGIRSVLYWTWYQKQELLAWLLEYIERSAAGIEIWKYPAGNKQAELATRAAAEQRVGNARNIVMVPTPVGEEFSMYDVQRIETGMAGAEVVKSILTEYFGHLMKRFILGQTLTSEAQGTGLGSGLAELHLDTYLQIVKYDATNLEETLTEEVVVPLLLANFPKFANVRFKFRIDTEAADVEAKLAAWKNAYEMGLKIKAAELYDMIGASIPGPKDEVLQQQQQQQPGMQPGQGPAMSAGGFDVEGVTKQTLGAMQAGEDAATVEKAMGIDRPENSERDRVPLPYSAEEYARRKDAAGQKLMDWKEDDHPRDDDGKFAKGEGGGSTNPSSPRGSKPDPLHSFANAADGITAHVWDAGDGGYHVTLHDDDADKTLPSSIKTKSLEQAIAKAKSFAGVSESSEGGGDWTPERHAEDYKKNRVRSRAFKAWFGDWEAGKGSKVVNDQGEPQETQAIEGTASKVVRRGKPVAVYHGTRKGGFDKFDRDKTNAPDELLFGGGFYFTEDPEVASEYSGAEKFTTTRYPSKKAAQAGLESERESLMDIYGKRYTELSLSIEQTPEHPNGRWAIVGRGFFKPQTKLDRHLTTNDIPNLKGVLSDKAVANDPYFKTDRGKELRSRLLEKLNHWDKLGDASWPANQIHSFMADPKSQFDAEEGEIKVAEYMRAAIGVDIHKPATGESKSVYLNIRKPFDMDKRHAGEDLLRAFVRLPSETLAEIAKDRGGTVKSIENGMDRAFQNTKAAGATSGVGPDAFKGEDLYWSIRKELGAKHAETIFRAAGYDGFTHIGGHRMGGGHEHRVWIAFEPNQIKASDNRGTFDPADDRLHYATEQPRDHGRFASLRPHELSETNVGKQPTSLPGQKGLFGEDPKPAAPPKPPRPQQKKLFAAGEPADNPLASMFAEAFADAGWPGAAV